MTTEEQLFFNSMPQMLPLYATLKASIEKRHPDIEVKVSKTQISLRSRYIFAMVSLPWRK